jgi:hypothetical protein
MKRYEYLTLYAFLDKKDTWRINYLGTNFDAFEYQNAIFNILGERGWELVGSSTFIGSETKNMALLPVRADTVTALTYTSGESFYFKREVTGAQNAAFFDTSASHGMLDTLRDMTDENEKKAAAAMHRYERSENFHTKILEHFRQNKNYETTDEDGMFVLFRTIERTVTEGFLKKTQKQEKIDIKIMLDFVVLNHSNDLTVKMAFYKKTQLQEKFDAAYYKNKRNLVNEEDLQAFYDFIEWEMSSQCSP